MKDIAIILLLALIIVLIVGIIKVSSLPEEAANTKHEEEKKWDKPKSKEKDTVKSVQKTLKKDKEKIVKYHLGHPSNYITISDEPPTEEGDLITEKRLAQKLEEAGLKHEIDLKEYILNIELPAYYLVYELYSGELIKIPFKRYSILGRNRVDDFVFSGWTEFYRNFSFSYPKDPYEYAEKVRRSIEKELSQKMVLKLKEAQENFAIIGGRAINTVKDIKEIYHIQEGTIIETYELNFTEEEYEDEFKIKLEKYYKKIFPDMEIDKSMLCNKLQEKLRRKISSSNIDKIEMNIPIEKTLKIETHDI